jgi:hypothetical protein
MPLVATRGGASASALGWSSAPQAEELGGMVLLKPTSIDVTGTSASINPNGSVEFTTITEIRLNGVFSAEYDNYLVNLRVTTSGNSAFNFRLSSGGTDNTTSSSYTRQYIDADGSVVNPIRQSFAQWGLAYAYNTRRAGAEINFYSPYRSSRTAVRSVTITDSNGAAITDVAGTHNQSASYDGFKMYVAGVNTTGLISVYGLVGA